MYTKWLTESSSPNSQRSRSRRLQRWMLIAMSSTLLFTSACSLLPAEEEEEILPVITPPTISKKPEHEVTTETLVDQFSASGKIMSQQEEHVYFSVDGKRIKDVLVKNGDKVKAGQVIAVFETEETEKSIRDKKFEIRKEEYTMKENLRKRDEMDELEFEQMQLNYEQKKQDLADLEKDLSKATLRAPFSGSVVALYGQKGNQTKAYDPIATIANTSKLTIAVKLSKDELEDVAIGMEVEVKINGHDKPIKGKIKALPNPNSSSSSNQPNQPDGGQGGNTAQQEKLEDFVIVQVDKLPANVQRGTSLGVNIIKSRKENAIVIPNSALRKIGSRKYVQVVEPDGTKREVDVEVGQEDSTVVEILRGLEPGQKVVGN
ncbi:efflux RND transporter periplasmic adaptor subunit [Paenibacillus agilis]|uniref:HlyD family efflux transporter periplasmic adaptor subunit n=1 Tax=Paenibacillus agilis TaxID=3020863 RepID=A0A559J2V7_9BACL|nr:HlyD family efflux transporter periplasmic adaptor subunit [Paenibacillus agilis]TVX94219.1 HlyD family efflux transporter periplasmic adaptor subunit [Paenibacillus agilis]